jgi:hypothetical protein
MAAVKISVSLPDDTLAKLDAERGQITRSAFIAAAVDAILRMTPAASTEGVRPVTPLGPVPPAIRARSQGRAPSSAAAKRNVRPIPKRSKS